MNRNFVFIYAESSFYDYVGHQDLALSFVDKRSIMHAYSGYTLGVI